MITLGAQPKKNLVKSMLFSFTGGREVAVLNPVTPIFYARILLKVSGIFYIDYTTFFYFIPFFYIPLL